MFEDGIFDLTNRPITLATRTYDNQEDLLTLLLVADKVKQMSTYLDELDKRGIEPTKDEASAMTFCATVAARMLPKLVNANPIAVEMMGNLDDLLKNLK